MVGIKESYWWGEAGEERGLIRTREVSVWLGLPWKNDLGAEVEAGRWFRGQGSGGLDRATAMGSGEQWEGWGCTRRRRWRHVLAGWSGDR